jgi:uncharacterized repeat protein (TIGR01451 family)
MIQSSFSRFRAAMTSLFCSAAVLLAILWFVDPPNTVSLATATGKIETALLSQLTTTGEHGRFIIEFTPHAINSTADRAASPSAHHAQLNTLQKSAAAAQHPTLQTLQELQISGEVSRIRPLWIINAIAVSGNVTAVIQLAEDPAVRLIRPDPIVDSFIPNREDDTIGQLLSTTSIATTGENWGPARIGAPHVWHGLGIDGSGVTVAIMDSGVDWQHPDLITKYRGYVEDGQSEHPGNWYDATASAQNEPIDPVGHGTHVAGIAVGQMKTGVAPGADWIAVKISDQWGNIYESAAHAGFQWLLAPNGDPNLAPDIINGSWGSAEANELFAADITLLRQAGILLVFAAGNSGPEPGTVGTPGGLENVFAIGASTINDTIASFSSRGPSPLTAEQNPWLVAPGTEIYSALPDGNYGRKTGTSMAAPHVSGALALLLAAAPSLTEQEIRQITAETAVPVQPPHPNNDAGYGRLDIYSAVQEFVPSGTLTGIVTENGAPLADIDVTIINQAGMTITYRTGDDGRFTAVLQPNDYGLRVDSLFYNSVEFTRLSIQTDQVRTRNIALTRKPTGRITGLVQDEQNQPLSAAEIQVQGTPVSAISSTDGTFEIIIPTGDYILRVRKNGYRAPIQPVEVTNSDTQTLSFTLAPAPTILLVDSGAWYYGSMISYFTEALQKAEYSYDVWTIHSVPEHVPTETDLAQYETVIWSAPLDSPGLIAADHTLATYLEQGGNLLISGQEVAFYDGNLYNNAEWWSEKLAADFVGEQIEPAAIIGKSDTPFADISLQINGPESAQNQEHPDISAPRIVSNTMSAFLYEDELVSGVYAGQCRPYNILYMGVGLEGVGDINGRAKLLEQAIITLDAPPQQSGVSLSPQESGGFALPGDQLVYTYTIHNRSETMTDTFSISYASADFSGTLLTTTLQLAPCTHGETVLHLSIPADSPQDSTGNATITAVSQNFPESKAESRITIKTAGDILFVDDYRFYPRGDVYTAALDELGLTYDRIDSNELSAQGLLDRADFLQSYSLIIWYTGYDWFAPLTPAEASALVTFLQNGGRLFLSSQDFQFYNQQTLLNRNYFGIFDHREEFEINALRFHSSPFISQGFPEILPLDFGPYKNNADGLIPDNQSRPLFWGDQGLPTAVGSNGPNWRTIFWGIPWETIPEEYRTAVLRDSLAWLTDLGDSTLLADRRVLQTGENITFTLLLHNSGQTTRQITMHNPLPTELTLLPETIRGAAQLDSENDAISWSGPLSAGARHTITYQMETGTELSPGKPITNSAMITVVDGLLPNPLLRQNIIWVETPDLHGHISAEPNAAIVADTITYTFTITNQALPINNPISVSIRLPDDLFLITDTLQATTPGITVAEKYIHWEGIFPESAPLQIEFVTTRSIPPTTERLIITAVLDDGITRPVLIYDLLELPAYEQILLFLDPFNRNGRRP